MTIESSPAVALEPCPFCGEMPSTHTHMTQSLFSRDVVEYLTITCSGCDILMSSEQQDELRERWNRRAAPRTPAETASSDDAAAVALWHRFAPSHHMGWEDESEKAIYRNAAAQIMAMNTPAETGEVEVKWPHGDGTCTFIDRSGKRLMAIARDGSVVGDVDLTVTEAEASSEGFAFPVPHLLRALAKSQRVALPPSSGFEHKPSAIEDSAPAIADKDSSGWEADTYREALSLAKSLWAQHYRETAPDWRPLEDLRGVLSQIDNMTTGLARKGSGWEAGAEAMREKAANHARAQFDDRPRSPDSMDFVDGYDRATRDAEQRIRALPLPPPPPSNSSGWQPIETAPRDGTWVLVYAGDTHVACFSDYTSKDQWWTQGASLLSDPHPTHWQPLPPPPSEATSPWQPFATAPKDGSLIDLWWNGWRHPDCRWVANLDSWEQKYAEGEDYWMDMHIRDDGDQPSHWMAKPPPPSKEGV